MLKQNLHRFAAVVVIAASGLAFAYGLHTDPKGASCSGTRVGCTTPTFPSGAAKLAFIQQPTSTSGGVAFGTQPIVAVQTAGGATVVSDVSAVTLALTVAGGATLSCTTNPRTAVSGVATFSGCSINNAGTYTLTATDGALTSAVSASLTISAPGSWTPVASANLGLNTVSGNDACSTLSVPVPVGSLGSTHICKTFNVANGKATNAACGGACTIAVFGCTATTGTAQYCYPPDNFNDNNSITVDQDPGRTSDATFACGDTNPVKMSGSHLWIFTQHVKFTGQCFQLQQVWIGDPKIVYPQGKLCNNVTMNDTQMTMFDVSGVCQTITINGNKIGPSTVCYLQGSRGGFAECKNNAFNSNNFGDPRYTGEGFYALFGQENTVITEPKVHAGGYNGSQLPNGVSITNNQFYGFQSRDPDGGPHAGCLWLGEGISNITVTGNTMNQCMTYMILLNGVNVQNLVASNNIFSTPKDAIRLQTDFTTIIDEPYQTIQSNCQDGAVTRKVTITNNSFNGGTGWYLDPVCFTAGAGSNISGNFGNGAGGNPPQPFSS